MRNTTTLWPLLALTLTIQPLAADLVNCDMARVVTEDDLLEDCLAQVTITRIDGEKQTVSAQGFLIEPGIHTINGRVTLDTTKCHTIEGDLQLGRSPGMEINFEAGRAYHVAYDRGSPDVADWRLIIWKVDQPCSMFQSCLPTNQP